MAVLFTPTSPIQCPSAPPEWTGAVVTGVVGGTADAPRIVPLREAVNASAEILALIEPGIVATEVLRFAAPCAGDRCGEFAAGRCTLAARIVGHAPAVTDALPYCTIRAACRWWQQEGKAACHRCPQVLTDNRNPNPSLRAVLAAKDASDRD